MNLNRVQATSEADSLLESSLHDSSASRIGLVAGFGPSLILSTSASSRFVPRSSRPPEHALARPVFLPPPAARLLAHFTQRNTDAPGLEARAFSSAPHLCCLGKYAGLFYFTRTGRRLSCAHQGAFQSGGGLPFQTSSFYSTLLPCSREPLTRHRFLTSEKVSDLSAFAHAEKEGCVSGQGILNAEVLELIG